MTEKWLEREIARGLQGLVALRLSGAPADDSITMTLDIWLAALDSAPVRWDEQQDTQRIRRAFRSIYRTCDRWPPPRLLLDNLGHRDPAPALPAPQVPREIRQKNVALLQRMLRQLGRQKTLQICKKRSSK